MILIQILTSDVDVDVDVFSEVFFLSISSHSDGFFIVAIIC